MGKTNLIPQEMHDRMHLIPPHSELSGTEVDQNAISIG